MEDLIRRIGERSLHIGIVGQGYVGLPTSVAFAEAGFSVIGIDMDSQRADRINAGKSYITDVSDGQLQGVVSSGRLRASTDPESLSDAEVVLICVHTPLTKTREPDISFIVDAVKDIRNVLRPGRLIVLESTTYPGTTDEIILPLLSSTGLRVGEDFFLAFSPERIDPGNQRHTMRNITKVVGGVTDRCGEVAEALYSQIVEEVVRVSSARAAEMVKLLENTFRAVNIALVNEVAMMCPLLGVDVWEVIRAAATKPFGFMSFYPGPGLGGHCIPVDPHYLSWKLRTLNYRARFIELASEINTSMPEYVVGRVADALNDRGKPVRGSKILVVGLAYKRDINDMRESPALDVIRLLQQKGAAVLAHDPLIQTHLNDTVENVPLTPELLAGCDCTVIITDHSCFDYEWIVSHAPLIVDTRNATAALRRGKEKVIRL